MVFKYKDCLLIYLIFAKNLFIKITNMLNSGGKKTFKFLCIISLFVSFFIFFSSQTVTAQNPILDSTLSRAKQLRNQKQFKEAIAILGNFEKKYPGNLWIEQLYAQTLFWMKRYNESSIIYRRALRYHPNNIDLKYDYALLLFDMNNFDKAREMLEVYTHKRKNNAAAEALLGKLFFWHNDYTKSLTHLSIAKKLNPNNKRINNLYLEVKRIISPQLEVDGNYTFDTQPLDAYGGQLYYSWQKSKAIDLQLSTYFTHYKYDNNSNNFAGFLLGNKFHINKIGMQVILMGGTYFGVSNKSTHFQGNISILQKIKKYFFYHMSLNRTFYDYTVTSVKSPLMINQITFEAGYKKPSGWDINAGIRSQFFPDTNYVNAYYAWILSKPLKFYEIDISLGYAFNYMDSEHDRYTTKEDIMHIEANGSSSNIEGIYNPYFTPLEQFSNSVLLNLTYNISNDVRFTAHASIGLYSKTLAPGFALDDSNPNKPVIIKYFAKVNYTPLDIGASFNAYLSDKLNLNVSYTFLQTYYYNSNRFIVGIKFYF